MDPVPDQLVLRESGSAGNRTRTSGYVARDSDYYITDAVHIHIYIQIENVRVLQSERKSISSFVLILRFSAPSLRKSGYKNTVYVSICMCLKMQIHVASQERSIRMYYAQWSSIR
jgi:hypothetical protein